MAYRRNKKDTPKKLRVTVEDLESLLVMKNSTEWLILRKVANLYIQNLKTISFNMVETDAHALSVNHAGLRGEARGIRALIQFVEKAGKKLEEK